MAIDIDAVLSQMTVHEKCALLAGADGWHTTGCPRLGVPAVMMADGPHGLRKQGDGIDILGFKTSSPVTCFPTASALACSFDEKLAERVGRALGEECRSEGVSVSLGPGVNMKRSPLCGRNFEYYSEDPYLAGKMAAGHIRGVQSCGVGTALKHFMGNSQEKARMTSDSVIDDRALHEVYMRAFALAVREGKPWSVMTAYNRMNGTYCSQNRFLIQDILRNTWGFDGITVTDWEALSSVTESMPAGLDLVMPGPRPDYVEALESGIRQHAMTKMELDHAARRVLEFINRCIEGRTVPYTCNMEEHERLAREAARRSAVLLKNNGILPLRGRQSVAVIGAFAKSPRYQGAGSSKINPRNLDCFWDAIHSNYSSGRIAYAPGYDAATGLASDAQLAEAAGLAAANDVAIVFAGLPDSYESEGFDRRSMRMPHSHVRLIEQVCAANPNTVVVLQGGAPFELPWRQLPAAILLMYLSGCEGGHAAADLLTGVANPTGKLAETWPVSRADTPTAGRFPDPASEILYTESIYIGYRYYEAVGVDVAYPFGFGLSYTGYAYRDLDVQPAGGSSDIEGMAFSASCTIENTGSRAGVEAVQLYIAPIAPGVYKAPQTLQGFTCVELQPAEAKQVRFDIPRRAFAHYDTQAGAWQVEAGAYEIRISASSQDIRLREIVTVAGIAKRDDGAPQRYHTPKAGDFCAAATKAKDDFRDLYGRPLPHPKPLRPFTIDSTLSDARHTVYGKVLNPFIKKAMQDMVPDERIHTQYAEMIDDMPIKSVHMQGWRMSSAAVMVDILNRRFVRGFRTWWRAQQEKAAQNGSAQPPKNKQ